MRALLLLLAVTAVDCGIARAAEKFPYEAVIQSPEVIVRSGPGDRYDPTSQLKTGDRVMVHRHDPGGWYMIAPPTGSFSWIDASHVQRQGPERGVVSVAHQGEGLPPRVVVWIGSEFTNDRKYFGRQLAHGDTVQIFGEETLPTDRGPVLYYKIAPPQLEYRWVKGDFVVPASEALPTKDAGPLANGPQPTSTPVTLSAPQSENSLSELWANSDQGGAGTPAVRQRELTRTIDESLPQFPEAPEEDRREELHRLDDELRDMLAQSPVAWQLDEMEQAYLQLQPDASVGLARQIGHRLRTIDEKRQIKARFDEFNHLTTQTNLRDAQLLSLQNPMLTPQTAGPPQVNLGPTAPFPGPDSAAPSGSPIGRVEPPLQGPPTSAQPVPGGMPQPQMCGAGVIQRVEGAPPGTPQHALVTPDGRLLAFLQAAPEVQLDKYLGHGMGLIGQRSHHPELGSDVIVVQRLIPVQLRPR